jgi:SAM-dependent methyltransferase
MTSIRPINYLSAPAEVSMADRWFDIASVDHFWIRRRFHVLQRLADSLIRGAREIAEVGCGHGLLQKQIEESYEREVSGFDLNETALRKNASRSSLVYCYDIHEQQAAFRERFDLIFLFDVLEHITDEDRFLKALSFHLVPGGRLIVNVPAGQWAFSEYDRAAGHVRRYSIHNLCDAIERTNFKLANWTYWGLPLLPTLLLRKLWLRGSRDKDEIISTGFDSRSKLIDRSFGLLAACEPIPHHLIGTSLMAILELDPEKTPASGTTGTRSAR